MKEIITERLILRAFRDSDYDDLFEYLSQLKDDEFEGYPDLTYENGREHLRSRIESGEFYAIELKENKKVIGNVYCGIRDFNSKEVGYILNKDYQKKGYATEALKAVVDDVFKEGTHRVYAECDSRNTPSWRLLERVGLRREACLKQNIFFYRDADGNPIWKDTYIYALLSIESKA
ncbi:MAG: GNAT family N-acetyltransferase [Lachnospiraceae bacterium]|nr:GNAT family N-acetyltransferase [Lachnospiraceae bacterium]